MEFIANLVGPEVKKPEIKEFYFSGNALYEKLKNGESAPTYNLYMGVEKRKKEEELKAQISNIINHQYNNLIYKNDNFSLFGKFKPDYEFKYRFKNSHDDQYDIQIFSKIKRLFISETPRTKLFIKMGFFNEFKDDLYCVYPYGNVYMDDYTICTGNIPLDKDGFNWLDGYSNNDLAPLPILNTPELLNMENLVIPFYDEIRIRKIRDSLDLRTSYNQNLQPNEYIYVYLPKSINTRYFRTSDIFEIIENNYSTHFNKYIKIKKNKKLITENDEDLIDILTKESGLKNSVINWFILNIIIPQNITNVDFRNYFYNYIKDNSKYIVTWEELIHEE
jgi:hypothetical protein